MTKIIAISDLHLESRPIPENVEFPKADILVLAGDIYTLRGLKSKAYRLKEFLSKAKQNVEHIVAVLGNHESYGSDYQETEKAFNEFYLEEGVWLLNNAFIELDGVTIFGGPLGSNFNRNPKAIDKAYSCINDYRFIGTQGRYWKPKDTIKLYDTFLRDLQSFGPVDIVVSHWSPSLRSCHPKWGTNLLNHYFHNDMDSLIQEYSRLWIHGHTHDYNNYKIGDSLVYCNPWGYYYENNSFITEEVIQLEN